MEKIIEMYNGFGVVQKYISDDGLMIYRRYSDGGETITPASHE